jgi:hypothetical protein
VSQNVTGRNILDDAAANLGSAFVDLGSELRWHGAAYD